MKLLRIRPAIVEEVPEISALDRLCFNGIWTEAGYRREIKSDKSILLTLSVEENAEFKIIGIGCSWSILEEAHITLLGIHPDYHRQGLGTLLLYTLLKDAVAQKLERATLEVVTSNEVAMSLYEKFGFTVAGTRKNYYPKTGADAFILWRDGLDKPDFQRELKGWGDQIRDRISQKYLCQFSN
ncbi:ribosomal-protein-alanine acetyltransferase [Xenococcus sp. PCC 7305]|uniref:ribosomal protein S18-alanine N-acetyltransferase n=1 Tax=Xenococcus sp. PCC 7305 TaxID=102125 RepID=UPI0002AC8F85|nr:ribosomal protein S18-alanine N-acetyltransferase [Xenococcus sp. PCC 7305]ELS04657.1 ribosomal-protein-alanine acetyltransferase [Xenococcus sp. PCC 7305]